MSNHSITGASTKDGAAWYDSKGREWQRWWCGNPAHNEDRQCRTSIPQKTGNVRKDK